MKVRCPAFRKYNDWAIQPGVYPCYLLADVSITFAEPVCKRVYHCYADGKQWLTITPYSMTLRKGYACDGSSSSPDVADSPFWGDNMLAAFFHDAFYQFSENPLFRSAFPRTFCDALHFSILCACRFKLRLLFRLGLFAFGWRNYGTRRKTNTKLIVLDSPITFELTT